MPFSSWDTVVPAPILLMKSPLTLYVPLVIDEGTRACTVTLKEIAGAPSIRI